MLKMTFLGDILCDFSMAWRMQNYRESNNKLDFSSVFAHLRPFLEESDYVIANLETPISIDNSNLTAASSNFNSPIEFAEAVKACGIDLVTTANNHCLDRGISGVKSTVSALDLVGLLQCGIKTDKKRNYEIIELPGAKVGLVAYTYGTNACYNKNYLPLRENQLINLLQEQEGYIELLWKRIFHGHLKWLYYKLEAALFPDNTGKNPHEKETLSFYRKLLIKNVLRKLKKQRADLKIALLHVGGQLNEEPSKYTKQTTDFFLRHGCDIVIDNHEHVIHGTKYNIANGTFSAYALGDCVSGVGVFYKPFNRLADYSIAAHVYYNEDLKKLERITFSVLKRILDDRQRIEVWPAIELYEKTCDCQEKDNIINVAELFSGHRYSDIQREYLICEYGEDRETD